VTICAEQYTLTYPNIDQAYLPEHGLESTWAPAGEIGWTNNGNWYLPQGTYRMCITYSLTRNPDTYGHVYRDNVVVDHAWNRTTNPIAPEFGVVYIHRRRWPLRLHSHSHQQRGHGRYSVTLSWFNANAMDLDLYVIEPNRSDSVWYGNTDINQAANWIWITGAAITATVARRTSIGRGHRPVDTTLCA